MLRPLDLAAARRVVDRAPGPAERWAPGFPLPGTEQVARATLLAAGAGLPLGAFGSYLVVRRADEAAVGDCGFHGPPDDAGTVEVGFALVPAARGAGLATEAVRLLCAWALAQPAVRTVTARVDPANTPSRAVLARAGFTAAGHAGELLRLRLEG